MVTGANGAIGREICRGVARHGDRLIVACRDAAKSHALVEWLHREVPGCSVDEVGLDLADEDSVRRCVDILRKLPLLPDGLINNAGVMRRSYGTDAHGRELTMTVNYHNTRLLTELLTDAFPRMRRVVFTTSITRLMPVRKGARFHQLRTYGASKRAITDWARQLCTESDKARREGMEPATTYNCADPGVVDTGMIRMQRWYDRLADRFFRPLIRTPRQGAIPALRAYYTPSGGGIFCRKKIHRL